MLKAAGFIFYMELILLWRRSQEWLYPLVFFVMVMILFPLAFTPDPFFLKKYLPGCIWIAALFVSLFSSEQVFFTEIEEGNLEQLLLSECPLPLLLLVKLSARWLATELPLILITPLLGLLFHLSVSTLLALIFSLFLGTPLLTLIGSLSTALTLGLRQQGILLGLLLLPLTIPLFIFGVHIVQLSQANLSYSGPLAFLAGVLLLAILFIPMTIAASLRISLDE